MMSRLMSRIPLRLLILGGVLAADAIIAVAGWSYMMTDLSDSQDHVEQLQRQLGRMQKSKADGQTALANAQDLREQVEALVLPTGNGAAPPRLQVLKAIEAQRLLHDVPSLQYKMAAESVEPVPGSGLEQVARPIELDLAADNPAALAAFWQDLLDKMPGKTRLDGFDVVHQPNGAGDAVQGHLAFRQLSLRPVGGGGEMP